ncbi:porin family protein [Marinobacter sp. TBZ242]|uniref:Porin family protein n=1 Tax=Marinobacter azerbaijanicus TaxID=3050455 RepID=A0ABT7I5Z3_9GAMM|nr:porin family protein [Marinobacter sp. TBZ242]MDL0429506.1 porin family protein [Marinobacter sp. TBZ242]
MKKPIALILGLVSVSALTVSQAATADIYKSGGGSLYAGLNYSFIDIESGNDEVDVGALSAKVGGLVSPFFGVEARAGFGVDDDRINGVDYSLDNFFGGYATLNLANESPATPYLVFGFTRVELEAQSVFGTSTEDETDFSYGAGVNIDLTPEVAGNLEYMRYYDKNGATVDGLGLGVTFSF